MKISYLVTAAFAATILTAFAGKLQIVRLEINSLEFDLPEAIRLRAEMAALQKPEFIASIKELGLEPLAAHDNRVSLSSWVHVYRASDGVIFLADNLNMALWVMDDAGWRCIVTSVRIDKTMGGAPAMLPAQYLGDGLFAVAETVPGTVPDKSKDGFPQARAVTFLIDSKDVKVKERSDAYVYDHNPPLSIPKEWANRYKIRSEDGSSNH
jgi:hypothetical protein